MRVFLVILFICLLTGRSVVQAQSATPPPTPVYDTSTTTTDSYFTLASGKTAVVRYEVSVGDLLVGSLLLVLVILQIVQLTTALTRRDE